MTKTQLTRTLVLLKKDLEKAHKRTLKISKALNVDENEYVKKALGEVEELIKLGEGK